MWRRRIILIFHTNETCLASQVHELQKQLANAQANAMRARSPTDLVQRLQLEVIISISQRQLYSGKVYFLKKKHFRNTKHLGNKKE